MTNQILILLGGLGVIALGLYFIFGKKHGPRPGMQEVEAKIVDHVIVQTTSQDHPDHSTTLPLFEYRVNGEAFRCRGTVGLSIFTKDKFRIGSAHTVWVDPAKPNRIYTREEKKANVRMGIILVIFGLAFLLLSLMSV